MKPNLKAFQPRDRTHFEPRLRSSQSTRPNTQLDKQAFRQAQSSATKFVGLFPLGYFFGSHVP